MSENLQNNEWLGSYVKLNVGGALFYTTISTLTREESMLEALFSGRMDVKTDDDGWVLLDRSGKHFGTILNYLRDGSAPLPDSKTELEELLAEARFYCIEGLKKTCENKLEKLIVEIQKKPEAAYIVIVKYPTITKAIFESTKKPIVKLTMNRYNNVFSYTSNSHDNLLRNIECLEKYALMFAERVIFIKDVRDKCEQNEICEWGFYWRLNKLKSIDCIAIHYSSEKRLIKVEFPESKIHEEMLFLLSISDRDLTDAEVKGLAIQRGSGGGSASLAVPVANTITLNVSDRDDTNDSTTEQQTTLVASASTLRVGAEDEAVPTREPSRVFASSSNSNGSNFRSPFATSYRFGRR